MKAEAAGKVQFPPLTSSMAQQFYGELPPYSMRGRGVVAADGELLGVFGVYYEGKTTIVAFSDFVEADILPPKARVRAGKEFMQALGEWRLPVLAYAKSERDARFLEHIGFEFVMMTSHGELFTWSP